MIAHNHPALGISPSQDWSDYSEVLDNRRAIPFAAPRPMRILPTPAPTPPSVNQISPAPVRAAAPPQVLVRISPTTAMLPASTAIVAPAAPASAAATGVPAPADTSVGIDSFLNWLTEETVFPGYPNGAVLAGGVIVASWLFGGKKGRR